MIETITYHDFFEEFNEVSQSYHARRSILGPVDIVDNETGEIVAELCATVWIFFKHSAFGYDEMTLMSRLATTLPGLRGGDSDD
ncbi:hypothetical protein [Lactobacillus delbrueckii]|uniref:hypothetical protein n=1 Tax=Lactobacillus delbrueckii TaxID=1584 RepID=UPI001785A361|nr:hypothetical protein [Lactobacillus delbrueckii]MBD5834734.1 hypothetical protein [Lactobacillus delbrueckii]